MKLSFPLFLLGSLSVSHGWVLDNSCVTGGYEELVVDGMTGAFDLAAAGADTFGITILGSGPVWQARKDLISYLFGEAMPNGNIDPTNINWINAAAKFDFAQNSYNLNNGHPSAAPADYRFLTTNGLIVYCDYSRFKEGENCNGDKNKDTTCDTSIGVAMPMGDIYQDCKSTSIFKSSEIVAWTIEYASQGVNRASQVQMCPSYLKSQQKLQIQTLKEQGKKASLARSMKKIGHWMDDPFKTPMDVKYTFDTTMLHEMTHAIPNAATLDVAGGGKSDSYGWKNCVKMSNSGGVKNADSYALFGLASRMISPNDGTTAQRPMQDGTIQVLPAAAGSSRAKRYVYPRAGSTSPNITLTVDHHPVTLDASDTLYFDIAGPSSTVTVSKGKAYTIGTDVISLGSAAVILDGSTVALPGGTTLSTITRGSSSGSSSFSKPESSSTSTHNNPTGPSTGHSTPSTHSSISETRSTKSSSSTVSGSSNSTIGATGPTGTGSRSSSTLTSSSSRPSGTSSSSSSTGSTTRPASTTSTALVSNTAVMTTTKGSSTTVIPITVIPVSKDGTTSSVTYISTFTSSGDIKPTGAWMCTGSLCDTGGGCLIPLFCGSKGESSSSWGLCCGWNPPSVGGGGGGPPAGGPQPGPPGNPSDPTKTQDPTSKQTGSKSDSKSSEFKSSTSSSTSSCSTQTRSACDTSVAVHSGTTSTITLECSTITACSASITGSATTSSASDHPMATPHGDYLNAYDTAVDNWQDVQQAVLVSAMADDTDDYITWSADGSSATGSSTVSVPASATNSSSNTSVTRSVSSTGLRTATSIGSIRKTSSGSRTSRSTTASSSTSSHSALPCWNYAAAHEGTGNFCTCSNGASTSNAPQTGSNTGSNYNPCPYTVAPPLPSTTAPPKPTEPFPFTTTLLDGMIEACETSTSQNYGGIEVTMCAGSVTTIIPATTPPPKPTPSNIMYVYYDNYIDQISNEMKWTVFEGKIGESIDLCDTKTAFQTDAPGDYDQLAPIISSHIPNTDNFQGPKDHGT